MPNSNSFIFRPSSIKGVNAGKLIIDDNVTIGKVQHLAVTHECVFFGVSPMLPICTLDHSVNKDLSIIRSFPRQCAFQGKCHCRNKTCYCAG
jgi:hypothetical protein